MEFLSQAWSTSLHTIRAAGCSFIVQVSMCHLHNGTTDGMAFLSVLTLPLQSYDATPLGTGSKPGLNFLASFYQFPQMTLVSSQRDRQGRLMRLPVSSKQHLAVQRKITESTPRHER